MFMNLRTNHRLGCNFGFEAGKVYSETFQVIFNTKLVQSFGGLISRTNCIRICTCQTDLKLRT